MLDGTWGDPFYDHGDPEVDQQWRERLALRRAVQRHASLAGAAVPRPGQESVLRCYAILPEADLIYKAGRIAHHGVDLDVAAKLRRMAGYS
jgi:hypothetical protein